MSTTIDEKVVEMRFDNRDFEKNAKTSIATLGNLEKSLKLDGAAKGFENVGAAANKLSLSGLTNAADAVAVKFSYMQMAIANQFNKIVDSAVSAGKRVVSAFTTEPIKTGFNEYELKMGSVQTIMAGTGESLETVNKYLAELNEYSDKTIYSFADMTSNIGKFTNAGVKLDDAVAAIKGISNVAALSGANTNEASRAMYNFSQALSAGYVKLIDWKSIENANMATVGFKEQLLEAAVAAGTLKKTSDGMYKTLKGNVFNATKNFNEVLQDQWMTTEVLVSTLKDYADETTDIGKKAMAAAQDVKTFTMLMDTLKEAAQSGWAQTWELLIGDFEEAKELWTAASNYFGDAIGKSAELRNGIISDWIRMGGRLHVIDAIKNAFQGILNILTPIKDAFNDVFPEITATRVLQLSHRLRTLTAQFKEFTEKHSDKIRRAFNGIFSAIYIGINFVKSLTKVIFGLTKNLFGLSGGVVDGALAFGDWVAGLRKTVKETDIFGVAAEKVVSVVQTVIAKIKEFGAAVAEKIHFPSLETLRDVLGKIWSFIWDINCRIFGILGDVGKAIGDFMGDTDMASLMRILNGSLLAGVFVKLSGLVENGGGILGNLKDTVGGIKDLILGINEKKDGGGLFDALKNGLTSLQESISVNKILKIAVAVGILAFSLKTISTIDSDKISDALMGLAGVFAELIGAVAIFDKLKISGSDKGLGALIGLAISVLILSVALKKLGDLDWGQIGRGLTAMGGVLLELIGFTKLMGNSKVGVGSMFGMILLAVSMKIFASALAAFAEFDWAQIGRGMTAMSGILSEVIGFTRLVDSSKTGVGSMLGMILLALSMKIFASAMSDFAEFDWGQIGRGLAAMGGVLLEVAAMTRLMPKNMIGLGVGLVIVSGALHIMASAMAKFGNLTGDQIAKGLVSIGVLLAELAIALNAMKSTLAGSAALLIAAVALTILMIPMLALSKISWGDLAKSLIGIAAALAIVGIAGAAFGAVAGLILWGSVALAAMAVAMLLLVPTLAALGAMKLGDIIKSILSIAIAFVVIGGVAAALGTVSGLILAFGVALVVVAAGVAIFGAGLAAIGIGLSMIGGALEVFVTAIANSAADLMRSIGVIISVVILALSLLLDGIKLLVPKFIETGFTILMSFLQGIRDNIYQIVTTVGEIITEFLNALAAQLPTIIEAGMNLIVQFINGLATSLTEHGPELGASLWNLFIAAINTVLSFLTGGAVTDIKSAGKQLMESGFVQGIKDKALAVKEKFTTAIKDAKAAVEEKIQEWKKAGKDLIEGLIKGIKDKAESLVKAAKGVVDDAIKAAKKLLGIKSPSRVFAEMGRYVDEGFVVGMQAYAGRVVGATEDLGRSAVGSMANAVKSISDVIDDNIDAQPTIRPVLDLTNVESGAGRLNSMLSRTRAMTISASMNGSYGSEIQNGAATTGSTYQFVQNNYSPKSLSRLEIYRQTQNQLETLKGLVRT